MFRIPDCRLSIQEFHRSVLSNYSYCFAEKVQTYLEAGGMYPVRIGEEIYLHDASLEDPEDLFKSLSVLKSQESILLAVETAELFLQQDICKRKVLKSNSLEYRRNQSEIARIKEDLHFLRQQGISEVEIGA